MSLRRRMELVDDVLHVKRAVVKNDDRLREQVDSEGLELVTPAGHIFSKPSPNCYILVSVRLKTQIDIKAATAGLENTLIKHKRLSSILDVADMMKSGRSGGARLGNNLGYMILRLPMVKQQNPLEYVLAATTLTRRKKLPLEAPFTYASRKLLMKLAGVKAATAVTYRMISDTSISFSNIVGPVEEVQLFGNPIVHLIPTVSGHPHSVTIHFQSYMEKVVLVVNLASEVIRDPKQLCIDCVEAFHRMKQAAITNTQHTM